MKAKHGSYMFHVRHNYLLENEPLTPETVPVLIHDNTKEGIDQLTMQKIAEKALTQNLYFNEDSFYYWMFDFMVWNHWAEMVHVYESEKLFKPLEINVYE